jgi:hypothetical protein
MVPGRPAAHLGEIQPTIMSSSPTEKDRFPLVTPHGTGMPPREQLARVAPTAPAKAERGIATTFGGSQK